MPKKITTTVRPDGTVETDFDGFSGTACLEAGKQLATLLKQFGVQVEQTSMTPKPELLASGETQQVQITTEAHYHLRQEG